MPILLEELPELIFRNSDSCSVLKRSFNYKKFDPSKIMKEKDENISLSYSTLGQFKECKFKFLIRNIIGLTYFKQNEALFVGNMVHKFLEELIKNYELFDCDPYQYKSILVNLYDRFTKIFDRRQYSTNDDFVEKIVMFINDRKKFEPDIFFDDYQYLNYLSELEYNYFISRKDLVVNGINLVKEMLKFGNKYNVKKYNTEQWFNYIPPKSNTSFKGKIDLHFSYDSKDSKKYVIVDYKTGNIKYFDWNQLNFYALAIGIVNFNNVHEYFFDIKNTKIMQNTNTCSKEQILDEFVSKCKEIQDFHGLFQKHIIEIRGKYTEKMNNVLNLSNLNEVHRIPFKLVDQIYDVLIEEFLNKEFKKKNYFSSNSNLCKWCDYFSNCPKFVK